MLSFLRENGGTILVLAMVAAIAVGVLASLRRNMKKGKTGCGCGCDGCPSKGICHPKN